MTLMRKGRAKQRRLSQGDQAVIACQTDKRMHAITTVANTGAYQSRKAATAAAEQ